jgi:hypothetical protein
MTDEDLIEQRRADQRRAFPDWALLLIAIGLTSVALFAVLNLLEVL